MTSAARKLQAPEAPGITSTWWRHKHVLAHLDVDPKTLRSRMNNSPDHIEQPWVNIGSVRRPEYRWLADDLDRWWIEVNRWRDRRWAKARAQRGTVRYRPKKWRLARALA